MNLIPTLKHLSECSNKRKGECKCTNENICKGCKSFYNFAYGDWKPNIKK